MGVQILNKDVSIISSIVGRAKATIGNVGGITGWAGGGAIVTPSPTPNWIEPVQYTPTTNIQRITGITTPITLNITWSGTITLANYTLGVYMDQNPSPTTIYTSTSPGTMTLTVNPNNYIQFFTSYYDPVSYTVNFTVTNVSDGNTVLDTFTLDNLD